MLLLILLLARFGPADLAGIVQSPQGQPVGTATVRVEQDGRVTVATTNPDGTFVLAGVTIPAVLLVSAPGFTTSRTLVAASPAVITLSPALIRESVVVSAPVSDAWRRSETGATTISADGLQRLPAVTTDEALRVVAGVTLFRRSSSRASNPTTHGVTMRGLSASGASRGLVLFDGIPLNDGFGGWVTWTRVPVLAERDVTVDRGPAGATFGSDALGGVIDITTKTGRGDDTAVAVQAGSPGLAAADASLGSRAGRWSWFGAASWLRTDGVIPVAPESRGAVDVPAGAEWSSAYGRLARDGDRHRFALSAWTGRDERGNGTVLQRNRMSGGTVAAAYQGLLGSTTVTARASVSPNRFVQTFSIVAPGRGAETLLSTQNVRTGVVRGVAEVGRPIPNGLLVIRGFVTRGRADFREVRATSDVTTVLADDGEGVAAQVAWTPSASVSAGAGVRREWRTAVSGRRDAATVGRASVAWRISPLVTVRGSAATSHRWPTLNELTRNFQVGAILTRANPELAPERAASADAAVVLTGGRWSASIGGYWTVVRDAIANVTIQTTPPIVRERQNAGRAEARGVEADGEARPWDGLALRVSAQFVDARFRDSADPALEGKRLPQVPRASVSLSGDVRIHRRLSAAVVYRLLSSQFDDDRNVFRLGVASQTDVRLFGQAGPIGWHVTVENALDSRIEVGRTPLVTLAPGRAVRAGLIWRR